MIEKMLPFQFLKKSFFYGSYQGMNYRIGANEGRLELCIWPGPFIFDKTPQEKKQFYHFDFSEKGYDELMSCLNEEYMKKNWEKEQLPF